MCIVYVSLYVGVGGCVWVCASARIRVYFRVRVRAYVCVCVLIFVALVMCECVCVCESACVRVYVACVCASPLGGRERKRDCQQCFTKYGRHRLEKNRKMLRAAKSGL